MFERYRPHVVFHAAAQTHVPLMEVTLEEAVTNNVGGTRGPGLIGTVMRGEGPGLRSPRPLFGVPRWYACRTRARAEKRVEGRLAARGFEAYLPVIEEARQWADRRKRVSFPLFPGYVFARFDLRAALEIVTTPAVVEIVSVNGRPTPVRDDEIASLYALEAGVREEGEVPQPVPYIEVGREVVVNSGAFSGMRGLLFEERARSRVIVRLRALRQAVSIELPRELVRAVA